jgi:hypothetical protein
VAHAQRIALLTFLACHCGCAQPRWVTLELVDSAIGYKIDGDAPTTVRCVTRTPGLVVDDLDVQTQNYRHASSMPAFRLESKQALFIDAVGYEMAALQLSGSGRVLLESPYRPRDTSNIMEMIVDAYRIHAHQAVEVEMSPGGVVRVPLKSSDGGVSALIRALQRTRSQ